MKTIVAFLLMATSAVCGYAQTVDYTIRYNLAASQYEVYARPNFSATQYNWGSAQVTVVTPASQPNAAFTVNSVAAGGWQDNSQAYDVQGSDFHGVGSNGQKVTLTAGQEVLLFTFVLSGGQCVPGLRLFVNGSDPSSSAAGMQGGDFSNTMYSANDILGGTNLYVQNYANTGTVCSACNLTAPSLSK